MKIASSNFQDSFLTIHRLNVCKYINFENFVIKAGFHRLWLILYIYVCVNHLKRNPTVVRISTGRDNSGVCMYLNIFIFLHH